MYAKQTATNIEKDVAISLSRVARKILKLPEKVKVVYAQNKISVSGPKGELSLLLDPRMKVEVDNQELKLEQTYSKPLKALAGTTMALINNMLIGVSQGYEKKLILVGVGYKAQLKGKQLSLALGFSHPVEFDIPEGITIVTPSATEVVVQGVSKQLVGQVAANIRKYRPPEPYKGKGIKYSDEKIVIKETKKK